MGVVDVDQTESRPLGGEQGGLGREVVVHVGVEVEVVAAEVGEHGDVEDHPVDPAHHQRVARHLHRAGLHAALAHHREQRVQVGRLRSGERGLHVGAGDAGADGADRGRGDAHLLQAGLREPGRRRLPLGAGHADHPERRGRVAVDAGREAAEDRARVVDHQERDPRRLAGAGLVGEDRDRAGVQCRAGVVDAVGPGSGQRGVDVARTDPLRAERDPRWPRPTGRRRCGTRRPAPTATPRGRRGTRRLGAGGGSPRWRRRSAPGEVTAGRDHHSTGRFDGRVPVGGTW